MTRRRYILIALCALVVIIGGWALISAQPPNSAPTTDTSGTCSLAALPREAADTIRRIHTAGPFPFPRNDGAVFGNHEGRLPEHAGGYYHEYTVITPGAQNRSTRRIITGGTPATDPAQYFYTGDHYESFCLITGATVR